jgi:hypothetical protein
LELYLKSLSAHEIEDPSALAGGAYIYAKSPSKSHKLEDLFDQAPLDIQQLIENSAMATDRLRRFGSIRKALEVHNPMFMASRYSFEPSSALEGVVIEALDELLQVLADVIRPLPRRWVPDTP